MDTYPRKENAARLEMQVHEVERDPTLQVTMDVAQGDLTPNILDTKVRKMRFGDRLVYSFVFPDASFEVVFSLLS